MGKKLMAQRMLTLLRENMNANGREAAAVLEWVADQRRWLWPQRAQDVEGTDQPIGWDELPSRLAEVDTSACDEPLFDALETASDVLSLDGFDRELLTVVSAVQRLAPLSALRMKLSCAGADLIPIFGQMAGACRSRAEACVRRSGPVSLGLLIIEREMGNVDITLDWKFTRLLDDADVDEQRLVDALAGIRQQPTLERADFAERDAEFDLLVRLLKGALGRGTRGVNILIHGPPGTGKTELARTLAAAAGATLFAVGEADADGDEPTRSERLFALNRAQRLLSRRGGSVLLFDEMEDLFSEASLSVGGMRRSGSKIFINRLLEQVAVPVIWTSNAVDCIDAAHVRRFSFVLPMNHSSARARARMLARAAEAEGAVDAATGLAPLVSAEPESASVARMALRTAALAGGSTEDAAAAGRSLLLGMRGGRALVPLASHGDLDLDLYQADLDVGALVDRIAAPGQPSDFSLLLTGPPGTGKTALAAYLAKRLDRPLAVRRASDLLSKWVGETEANIAEAFADARDNGSLLLFDEADSLLADRSQARQSWEITQVNEMLTWMDNHPLPFVAATNFAQHLDPAALRRFVFKADLEPLSGVLLDRAFVRFFGVAAPAGLHHVRGLTPGDFAIVRRQLRYRIDVASPDAILRLLEAEAAAKPHRSFAIGF